MLANTYKALSELASHNTGNIPAPNYYQTQKCSNEYIQRIVMYNHETGKYFQPKCKSYSCPKHGFIQRERLAKAIQKWLKGLDHIRFWTFTIRKTNNYSVEEFNELYKRVWHRFITELRRNKMLTKREQKMDYIKVYEVHKTGCLHIHLFATEYIHWTKLQSLWDYSVGCHFNINGKSGNVHTKRKVSLKDAAWYIAKYVTKIALQVDVKIRAWSKSGRFSIFDKKLKSGKWSIIRKDSIEYIHLQMGVPILVQISPCVTIKPPKKYALFPNIKIFSEFYDPLSKIYLFSINNHNGITKEHQLND